MKCRSCGSAKGSEFLNLHSQPASNSFLTNESLKKTEPYYPLEVFVCSDCYLVQVEENKDPQEIFNEDYVYFTSNSEAFVEHAKAYVEDISDFLELDDQSLVVEAASNDGYLLQFFQQKNIPCLGIEPSESTAIEARAKGIETITKFFGKETAEEILVSHGPASLFAGNNVLAHVPDINDFVGGIATILADEGVATLEFPHLLNMMVELQFDTVYHEHFSYISLIAAIPIFAKSGLTIFRVEELEVHGGSLRIYCAKTSADRAIDPSVKAILDKEIDYGLDNLTTYNDYQSRVDKVCFKFLHYLISARNEGAKIVGYGAAAKGNTFLNYCGVKPNLISFVSDLTPAKQGKFLPGSHIPVCSEDMIKQERPDIIVILPWNWAKTIEQRLSFAKEWGAKLVTAIPDLKIF